VGAEHDRQPQGNGSTRDPREPRLTRGRDAAQVRGVLADQVIVSVPLDPLLSLKALAGYSSLSVRTLRQFTELAPEQALPCYRLPGKILVRRSTFDTWLEQYHSRGRPGLTRALEELGLLTASRRHAS